MSILNKVKEILEKEHIEYEILEHNLAYTALETAQAQHIPGRQLIKTVIVSAGDKDLMCVLPAIYKVDFNKLAKLLNLSEVRLANEGKIALLFPGSDVGAMPPFGQIAGIKTYIDKSLEENESVVFNAGTHTEMVRIKFKDFIKIANPIVADFGIHI